MIHMCVNKNIISSQKSSWIFCWLDSLVYLYTIIFSLLNLDIWEYMLLEAIPPHVYGIIVEKFREFPLWKFSLTHCPQLLNLYIFIYLIKMTNVTSQINCQEINKYGDTLITTAYLPFRDLLSRSDIILGD